MHGKHTTADSGLHQPLVGLKRNPLTCLEPPSVPQASCTMPPAPPPSLLRLPGPSRLM